MFSSLSYSPISMDVFRGTVITCYSPEYGVFISISSSLPPNIAFSSFTSDTNPIIQFIVHTTEQLLWKPQITCLKHVLCYKWNKMTEASSLDKAKLAV